MGIITTITDMDVSVKRAEAALKTNKALLISDLN
jgi:hypothetical protein